MPNDNKGWNDDEETIINFSARAKAARPVEEPLLTPPESDLGLDAKEPAPAISNSRSAGLAYPDSAPISAPANEIVSAPVSMPVSAPEPLFSPDAPTSLSSPPVVQGPSIPAQPLSRPPVPSIPPMPPPVQNIIDPPTRMDVPELRNQLDAPLIPPLGEDPPTRQEFTREDIAPPPTPESSPVSQETSDYVVAPPDPNNEKVNDVAFLVIMKTPSVRLHQMFRLDKEKMDIGRAFDTPIFLDDKTVSLRHAAVRYEQVGNKLEFVLYDLAALNGTYLNGAQVYRATLKDGDRISIGLTELVFKRV